MMFRSALHPESSLLSTLGEVATCLIEPPSKRRQQCKRRYLQVDLRRTEGPQTSGSTCTLLGTIVHGPCFCGRHNSVRHSTWRVPALHLHSASILGPLSRGSIWHMEA